MNFTCSLLLYDNSKPEICLSTLIVYLEQATSIGIIEDAQLYVFDMSYSEPQSII